MPLADNFYMDISRIHIAHEFVLDRINKCEYPQGRERYGLVYALKGRAEYNFHTGERFSVTEGDLLFLTPHAAYSIFSNEEFRHYTVNFEIHEGSSELGPLKTPYCLICGENTDQIEREFRKLVGIWSSKKVGYEMKATGKLYDLISLFYFDFYMEKNHTVHGRLLPAKEHIEQNFEKPISLEQLAELSYMSVTNFRREWKKLYDDSPLQYRDNIRLYYAKEYLSSGYYTVSEIAEKCGFEDPSYFVRFFKKHTGFTPGAYKKRFVGG